MHEYGITESIISTIIQESEEKNLKSIDKVNLVIGRHSGFSSESIQFYFDILKNDTILKNTFLNFKIQDIILECPECGNVFNSDKIFGTCIKCGYDKKFKILSGNDFYIESLEVNEE